MMKLSLMKAIVATLTDTGESALANQLLSQWPHDPGTAKFLRTSANALFTFTHAQQPYVLRFNHTSERSAGHIRAEIAYLHYLSAAGLRIARPIRSSAGRYVESLDTTHGLFHAVVFEAVAGEQFEIDTLTLDRFSQWGKTLGSLHHAAQTYIGAGRPTWQDHVAWLAESIPASEQAAKGTLDKLRAHMDSLPVSTHNFGLIHYDFELDNLLWTEYGLAMIDFDDSAWYWFAADIAYALRDLFGDDLAKLDLESAPFRAFISGYRTEKDISPEDIQLLPVFLRLHHVMAFAKLLRSLENDDQSDEPAWAAALRNKLELKIQAYRDEFIAYTR
jgi:Ser/Thr protein kinase RdoA (MazF antagonist)